nr:MAG TPA: hypothetical protein [Caudoviricetes sp.]
MTKEFDCGKMVTVERKVVKPCLRTICTILALAAIDKGI